MHSEAFTLQPHRSCRSPNQLSFNPLPKNHRTYLSCSDTAGARYHAKRDYSLRRLPAGLAIAARTAWTPIVSNAIPITIAPAATNTHHPSSIR
jgi:hypothetical protein